MYFYDCQAIPMTENWIEKIQQDSDLQMLLGLAGGGLVLFVMLLIVIVVRLNNKRKKQEEKTLGEIRVQSTHIPENLEPQKKHLVFQNKITNEDAKDIIEPKLEPEPTPIITNPSKEEEVTLTPETSLEESVVLPETTPEPEPNVISPSPVRISSLAIEELSEEDKKKEILKAIVQTRSREENLRILEERLRELRGETKDEPSIPEVETQPIENLVQPIEEDTVSISIPTEHLPEKESEPTETIVEFSEPVIEESKDAETVEDEPEAIPIVEVTTLPTDKQEEEKHPSVSLPTSGTHKTFTEWLTELSGKKR